MLDLFEAIEEGREHPRDYFGSITELQDEGWVETFGRHRDSDNLQNSNFDAVLKTLSEKFELNDDYQVLGSSHWAVGWCDQIMVRALQCKCEDWEDADITAHPDNAAKGLKLWRCHTCGTDFGIESIRPVFYEMLEFKNRLEQYPLLDEEDFSRREHEELMEYIEREVSAICVRFQNGEEIKDDFEANPADVARILFDEYSVSHVDDLSYEWMEDAVLTLAEKEGAKL